MSVEDSPEGELKTSKNLSQVVRGTAEDLLTRLEETVSSSAAVVGKEEEDETLQDSEPGPLTDQTKDVEEVLNIISQSIYREGQGQQLLLKLSDRLSLLSVVSHSLSSYITTLDPAPLERLSSRIAAEVSLWICDLFRFRDGAAHCHDDTREGLVKVARMALHKAYPKMSTEGFEALFARPPVVYLTSATYLEIANHVCVQLGLPLTTVRVLQGATREGMEEMIREDKAAGRFPALCIANVHSSLYQVMNASVFETVCKQNDIWLHLEGHAVAGLALVGDSAQSLPTGDSISLTIGSWLGIPSLPFATIYKSVGLEPHAQSAGLSTVVPSVRLNCLPLWCILRSLGKKQFRNRIGNMFELMEIMNGKLAEFKSLRVLSQRPEAGRGFLAVESLLKGSFGPAEVFRTVPPAMAFQYVSEEGLREEVPTYFNNLNSWLGQTMQRDCPQIPLEIVDVETTGFVLRLCPFESLAFSGVTVTEDDLDVFVECLENQTTILDATVKQRRKFIELIDGEPKLQRIEISHWAGLGGVSYVPLELRLDDGEGEKKTAEHVNRVNRINQRNVELLQRLRTLDSAFSLGESGGRVCIRFGMVSMDTDVEELLSLVVTTGAKLDEDLKQLSQMSDLVLKGIEQAAEDLRKESDEAIWQEGMLRHVPLVGSLYNWISPLQKQQIKGRFLSLDEGKLQSTEIVYKHRGQVVEGDIAAQHAEQAAEEPPAAEKEETVADEEAKA